MSEKVYLAALAGNPNVGKSTVFNSLTGLRHHTGNWTGKTVESSWGKCVIGEFDCMLADLPGAYSLLTHSAEEEAARDFLLQEDPDVVIVVCGAATLERNMNFLLQVMELTSHVVLCVNLMDEGKRMGVTIDLSQLSDQLGIPVVGTSAGKGEGLDQLEHCLENIFTGKIKFCPHRAVYEPWLESAITEGEKLLVLENKNEGIRRWVTARVLENHIKGEQILGFLGGEIIDVEKMNQIRKQLPKNPSDAIADGLNQRCKEICKSAVQCKNKEKNRIIDQILTGPITGSLVMIGLLLFLFWLTIQAANVPSQWLSNLFNLAEERLYSWCTAIHMIPFLRDILVCGVFRVVGWVTSVMLPPMAIFFPLFTFLEDLGYLPRAAFHLDFFHFFFPS